MVISANSSIRSIQASRRLLPMTWTALRMKFQRSLKTFVLVTLFNKKFLILMYCMKFAIDNKPTIVIRKGMFLFIEVWIFQDVLDYLYIF